MYFIVFLSFIILLRLITCFAYYFFLSFIFFFVIYLFYSLVLFLLHILIHVAANDNLLSVLKSRNLIMTVHTNISGVVSQFKTKLVKVLKR